MLLSNHLNDAGTTGTNDAISLSRLHAAHLEDLRRSGLNDQQITNCGFYSEANGNLIAEMLGWERPARALGACMVIPFWDSVGMATGYLRIKPSKPRKDKKSGKLIKYESPRKKPNRLFIPPHTRHLLTDPAVDLVLTEGEKKAAKADQEGVPCLGLVGVYGWQVKRERNAEGKADGKRMLIPDLDAVVWTGRKVFIIFDSDAATNLNVRWAEFHLAKALKERGANVLVVRLPEGTETAIGNRIKVGLDDYLVEHGPDKLRQLMAAAIPPQRPTLIGGRRQIRLGPDEYRVNDEVVKELANDLTIYQRGGELVRVAIDPATSPRIEAIPPAALRDGVSRRVEFYTITETEQGEIITPKHPPMWSINAVAARGTWPQVRPLAGVVSFPVLRPDGSILMDPGYDSATNLFLHWSFDPLPIPKRPTIDDARTATKSLLDIVSDFPFQNELYKAAWLAGVLTPLARPAFVGPAPLFMVDGNTRGCGKGMLQDIVSRIVIGRPFPVISYPTQEGKSGSNEDEVRKKITTLLVYGDRIALFDNLTGAFGDGTMDRLLTGTEWQDRILGGNRQYRGPLTLTVYATGNNVSIVADTARRICRIRLESPLECPEDRIDFNKPRLLEWVSEHRLQLLANALTILDAFHRAGQPDQGLRAWGSYEAWSRIVRNAIAWVGLPDPGEARMSIHDAADETARALRLLIAALPMIDPDRNGLTATEILKHADPEKSSDSPEIREMLAEALGALIARPDARRLGKKLGSLRCRVVNDSYLDHAATASGINRWAVFDAASNWTDPATHPPHPSHPSTPEDVKDVVDVNRVWSEMNSDHLVERL